VNLLQSKVGRSEHSMRGAPLEMEHHGRTLMLLPMSHRKNVLRIDPGCVQRVWPLCLYALVG
jgi:hypothetical protein